jgi:hypothetical protein
MGLLAVLIFASQEFAVMASALLALDTLCRLLARRRMGLPSIWPLGVVLFWGAAAAGMGALARVALAAPALPPPPSHVILASGYVMGLLTPPWVATPFRPFWTILYLGTAALVCLPFAWVWQRRRVGYWALAAGSMALMTLGPYVHLRHLLPTLQPPFDDLPTSGVPGPYWIVSHALPLVRFFRTPYRWTVAAHVVLAVLVALAVAGLRARIARPAARAVVTAAVLVAVVALATLDARGLRAPVVSAAVPAPYRALTDDTEPSAVLELPSGLVVDQLAAFSSLYMYYQTTHRKMLLEGTVSRLPPGRELVVQRTITDLASLPYVKYVVLHRDLLAAAYPAARRQVEAVEEALRSEGQLVTTDGAVEVYRLRTYRPGSVPAAG